jgi:hypothetical protein
VILNTPRSLLIDQTLELRAVALDDEGQIVITGGLTWIVDPPDLGSISSDGLFTAGPSSGEASVTARWTSPEGDIVIDSLPLTLPILEPLPSVEAGWRVRVGDGRTGDALSGISVYVDQDIYVTDESGVVSFDNQADRLTFTVMAPGYDTVTVVGISERGLYIPLQPLSDDSIVAGFTGEVDFSDVSNIGQVEIGLAGAAFSDGLSQISLFDLLGQLFFTEVDIGPVNATVPLPGGLILKANIPFLGEFSIKDTYSVLTRPGFQMGWSFGGKIGITTVLGLLEG